MLRRNGSVLEVSSDGELGASIDGFSLLRSAPRNLDDFRALGLGKELFLRVNPNIIVDVEVTAGSLNTERVPHLGKIRVTAGGAKLLDVAEINDALIQAGQATIKGAISTGRNRIRAESGSLSITLGDESDVTIKGDAQLGKVSWSGGHDGAGDEVVMGNGSAKLDIEVVMGHAQVRVGSDARRGGGLVERANPPTRRAARAPGTQRVPGVRGAPVGDPAGLYRLRQRARRGVRPVRVLRALGGRVGPAAGVPGLARQPA